MTRPPWMGVNRGRCPPPPKSRGGSEPLPSRHYRTAPECRVLGTWETPLAKATRLGVFVDTSVSEHADDAAALLDALRATPAIVIGRSYGGAVALDLAMRHPAHVPAPVLLEPAPLTALAPAMAALDERVRGRARDVAATDGPDAVGRAFIGEVLGPSAWDSFRVDPPRVHRNSAAILAELDGEPRAIDAAALAGIDKPTFVVAAADSHDAFRAVTDTIVAAMPDAHLVHVAGGHLVSPADPAVISYLGTHTQALAPVNGRSSKDRSRPGGPRTASSRDPPETGGSAPSAVPAPRRVLPPRLRGSRRVWVVTADGVMIAAMTRAPSMSRAAGASRASRGSRGRRAGRPRPPRRGSRRGSRAARTVIVRGLDQLAPSSSW